jgi:aspartate racemase
LERGWATLDLPESLRGNGSTEPHMNGTLGILGGMGPLASAEFLATLYRLYPSEREQEAPACLLLSDPSLPDRSEEILRGDLRLLAESVGSALERLVVGGADRIVIACVTVHAVLPTLPVALTRRVISLIDLAVDECLRAPMPRLLLASSGARRARLFESHPRWAELATSIRFPAAGEQEELHRWIYRLKAHTPPEECVDWLDDLRQEHGAEESIFACTELHLLHRAARPGRRGAGLAAIDPLLVAARDLRQLLVAPLG